MARSPERDYGADRNSYTSIEVLKHRLRNFPEHQDYFDWAINLEPLNPKMWSNFFEANPEWHQHLEEEEERRHVGRQ